MDRSEMYELAERILNDWNSQDVNRVVAAYTDDAAYVDPNTRGPVRGSDAMSRYLTKLFSRWKMHWTLREAFLLEDKNGCAVLWHATFQKPEGGDIVETDGMDIVFVREGRIARNEVYFDRSVLAPLLGFGSS